MRYLMFFVIFLVSSVQAKNVTMNLVNPVKFFVNHELQLNSVNNLLGLYGKVGLTGISGIGKTQVVRTYAYENKDKYDLIWFFDCNADLNTQFVSLAKAINNSLCKNCNLSSDVKDAKKDVMEYLTSQNKWLLVFDNLKINQNEKLQDVINWEHNGHIILCSQDSKELPQNVKLKSLNKEDSRKLIKNILGDDEKIDINSLIEAFDGNPILTVTAATFLKENKYMSVSQYLKTIGKSKNKVKDHIAMVFKTLNNSSQILLQKIALINNQSFSQNILKRITGNSKTLIKDLYSLTRFGLINNLNDKEVFEMHDTIKEAVLELADRKITQRNVNDILDKINSFIPHNFESGHIAITSDDTFKNNLEILLENAEKYKADTYKIMELRRFLIAHYINIMDYYNCQKMEDWFLQHEKNKLNLMFMSEHNKSVYTWYLAIIGVYNRATFQTSKTIKFLTKAKDIAIQFKEHLDLKFMIFSQLAQTYAYSGDVNAAMLNMQEVEKIMSKGFQTDFDLGTYWFIKAKIFLEQGKYKDALEAIENNIKCDMESNLPQDTFTAPTYILKAEILNYMENFQKAHDILKTIYEQETQNIKHPHVIHADILTQLSRSELGLGNNEKALKYAIEAKNINLKDKVDIRFSQDIGLAMNFVAEADCLSALGHLEEAVKSYSTAEMIYYNNYKQNMKNMDDISYLYYKGAVAGCNMKNQYWYNKFKEQHLLEFGIEHERSKKIMEMSCIHK